MDAFFHWWQHIPEHLDPVIFSIGSFRLQYYGLMYIVAFAVTYLLARHRLKTETRFDITPGQALDLMTAMILGVIVGGRLGYVLFYNLSYYLRHPLEIDLFIPAIPLGYTFGRIGNFINGELYGRVTDLPIGMIFPLAPDRRLRHPSQLYEALFEGVVLFAVLWVVRKRPMPSGATLALYLIGYGTARFFIEFVRQPDAHLRNRIVDLFPEEREAKRPLLKRRLKRPFDRQRTAPDAGDYPGPATQTADVHPGGRIIENPGMSWLCA